MNPKIRINLKKLAHNAAEMQKLCASAGIQVSAVTKGFCAKPQAVSALIHGGIKSLADSRIENLQRYESTEVEKMLLRLPMISQVEEVVRFSHISLNSQWSTIQALNNASKNQGLRHGVILMADVGDLREGVFGENAFLDLVRKTSQLSHVQVKGIGTNLTCFGAVIPDENNLGQLVSLANQSAELVGSPIELVSGGNSSSLSMLLENRLPAGINHLRIGEGILLGTESAYGNKLPGFHQDCFQLVAELVEVEQKPSMPIGTTGKDAFGQIPHFEDRGVRSRAIAAVGKQDFGTHSIKSLDEEVEILGASSDHLILDVTDAAKEYRVGDELTFSLGYGAMLALNTSAYIATQFVEG